MSFSRILLLQLSPFSGIIYFSLSTRSIPSTYKYALVSSIFKKKYLWCFHLPPVKPISLLFKITLLQKLVSSHPFHLLTSILCWAHYSWTSNAHHCHPTEVALVKIPVTSILLDIISVIIFLDVFWQFSIKLATPFLKLNLLASRTPHPSGFPSIVLTTFSQSVLRAPPPFLNPSKYWVLHRTYFSVYILYLSDHLQSHGFKYHPYSGKSQI